MDSRSRRVRLVFFACGFLALLPMGCASWRASTSTPEQIVAAKPEVTMRVTAAGLSPIVLEQVSISGDTLYGYTHRLPAGFTAIGNQGAFPRVAIPQELIQKIEVRKTDAAKTTLLVVGISLGISLIAAIAASGDNEPASQPSTGSSPWSCPVILCLSDGVWHLDSGTYAGAIMPALARSDVDNLDHASALEGLVHVRLAGLSDEIEHVDALSLLAVDHDPGLTVAPDANGNLWALGKLTAPTHAKDFEGREALTRVNRRDEWCWESALVMRDASAEEALRDGLEIEFPRPAPTGSARLVVDGANTPWAMHLMREVVAMHGRDTQKWYDHVAADPSRARRIRETMARETFLQVFVWTRNGWERQGACPDVGPESLKRLVVPLDLSRVDGATVRVRLECTPSLWLVDCASIDYSRQQPVQVQKIRPESARDLHGRDVLSPLVAEDRSEYVIAPGDTAAVTFRVPQIPAGQERTYLARTTGWYRINAPEVGEPQTALLERMETEPRAVARFAVTRMNDALVALASWQREDPR